MTAPFSFGPPPAGSITPAPAAAVAALAQAAAPPPASIAQLMAQSLQGMHDADQRFPYLAPGGQFEVEITDVRFGKFRHIGVSFFIDIKVLRNNLGLPEGTMHTVKIDGLDNDDKKGMAFRDLKDLLHAGLAKVELAPGVIGLPAGWNGTDPEWISVAVAAYEQRKLINQRAFLQTKQWEPKAGSPAKPKVLVSWAKAA